MRVLGTLIGTTLVGFVSLCIVAHVEAAVEVTATVVSDPSPGLGASHGLKKLMAALEAKGLKVQRTADPAAAKGDLLIIVGLVSGVVAQRLSVVQVGGK